MYHHDVCSVSKCSILCSIRPPHNLETPPCLMFRKASRWAPRMTVPRMPGPASPQGAPQAKWANFQTMKSKIVASYIQWSASELCITKFNLKLCLIQASSQPDEKTVGKKEEVMAIAMDNVKPGDSISNVIPNWISQWIFLWFKWYFWLEICL